MSRSLIQKLQHSTSHSNSNIVRLSISHPVYKSTNPSHSKLGHTSVCHPVKHSVNLFSPVGQSVSNRLPYRLTTYDTTRSMNGAMVRGADAALHTCSSRSDWRLQVTESRVLNHSRVGHGQRTGGAEQRGRLASRCKDSVLTLALFRDQTKACRDL